LSPFAALIVDVVMTAFWPIIGAAGMTYYSGILFPSAGLVIGLVCLLPFLAANGRWRVLLDPKTAPTLAAMGFFSGMASIIFISALAFTTPANAAIMAQIEVFYSAVLCAFILREPVTKSQAAASVLIVAGTGLVMLHDLTSPRWKGDLMMLATPWMFQVSHIFSKKLPKNMDPISISGGRVFYGILSLIPFVLWAAIHGGKWSWEPKALAILAVQGVTMSCLNFILWYRAIGGMDLSKATAIMLSYPALTVLFSWALGREPIDAVQIVGLVVTLAGAYWMSMLVLKAQAHAGAKLVEPEAAPEV
jgi:drug/metabolite transporter (DMT)-like permease